MDDLKKALDQIRGETRETFSHLRTTIREQHEAVGSALEKQQAAIAQQGEAIKHLEMARREHSVAIAALQVSVSDLQASVSDLQASVSDLQASVSVLQASVSDLQTSDASTQGSILELQRSNASLQEAHGDTRRALARQTHVLDQSLAKVAEDFDRHSENVGKVIYTYVDDLHALKTEVRGISSRVDALEQRNPPAA